MINSSLDLKTFLNKTGLFISSDYQDKGVIYYLSDCELKLDTEIVHSPLFHDPHELYKWIRENKQILMDQFMDNP